MLLACHPVISNPENFGFLPPRVRTLIELAQIAPEDLKEHFATGVVHWGMTRKDTAKLKPAAPKVDSNAAALATVMQDETKVLLHFVMNIARPDIPPQPQARAAARR